MHVELISRSVIHADEVPCQVLHEEGKDATSKSYMWVYLSGTDGEPKIVLYDYCSGRGGDHPIKFLAGFTGMLQTHWGQTPVAPGGQVPLTKCEQKFE